MKRFLLAIDPGLATGIALVDTETVQVLWSYEVDWIRMGELVAEALDYHRDMIDVVMERFTITLQTAKNSQAPFSLQNIGIVNWLCQVNKAGPPNMQSPGDAKQFSTNDKLKALGLWHKGGAGHANDALRHALLYMVKNGFKDRRMLGS